MLKKTIKYYFYFNMLVGFTFLIVAILSFYGIQGLLPSETSITLDKKHFQGILNSLPAVGILIGGQIAGLAVFLNINHSAEQKEKELKKEKEDTKKILDAYFSHLSFLSLAFRESITLLKEHIKHSYKDNGVGFSSVKVTKSLNQLEHEIEELKLTIDTIFNYTFSKYLNEEELLFLLHHKGRFSFINHSLKRFGKDIKFEETMSNIEAIQVSITEFKSFCDKRLSDNKVKTHC